MSSRILKMHEWDDKVRRERKPYVRAFVTVLIIYVVVMLAATFTPFGAFPYVKGIMLGSIVLVLAGLIPLVVYDSKQIDARAQHISALLKEIDDELQELHNKQ